MPEILHRFIEDFRAFSSGDAWASLGTLTVLELVLGIDNLVFLSILTGRLPEAQQPAVRKVGLGLAILFRVALLFGISLILALSTPLFTLPVINRPLNGRECILLGGGLFLLVKATSEIYAKLEAGADEATAKQGAMFIPMVIAQIVVIDMVFSLDSIITAVGMARNLAVMVTAVVISGIAMMWFAAPLGEFVNRHPSMKVLALSFLILIGALLVAEAFGEHVNRGYVYFAMGFSLTVELINMRVRKKHAPVELHNRL